MGAMEDHHVLPTRLVCVSPALRDGHIDKGRFIILFTIGVHLCVGLTIRSSRRRLLRASSSHADLLATIPQPRSPTKTTEITVTSETVEQQSTPTTPHATWFKGKGDAETPNQLGYSVHISARIRYLSILIIEQLVILSVLNKTHIVYFFLLNIDPQTVLRKASPAPSESTPNVRYSSLPYS